MPDDVSKKSLKVLDKKLQMLAEHADFHVNINSVLGGGIRNPEDALVVGQARYGTGLHFYRRHHPRWRRPTAAAGGSRARSVPRDEEVREETFLAHQLFPGKHRQRASRATGAAAPVRAISISARTGWCTTVRSSAAFRPSRSRSTRWKTSGANTSRKNLARRLCTISCVHQISYFDFFRGEQTRMVEPVPEEQLVHIKAASA